MIDTDLCAAIRGVLHECDGRPTSHTAIYVYVRPRIRGPVIVADVWNHLLHLENAGEVDRHANRDDKTLVSWTLTDAGKTRPRI